MGKAGPYVVGALLYEACCRSDVLAINCNGKRVAAEGRHWAKGVWGGSNCTLKNQSSLMIGLVQMPFSHCCSPTAPLVGLKHALCQILHPSLLLALQKRPAESPPSALRHSPSLKSRADPS